MSRFFDRYALIIKHMGQLLRKNDNCPKESFKYLTEEAKNRAFPNREKFEIKDIFKDMHNIQ